jgi:serpin B
MKHLVTGCLLALVAASCQAQPSEPGSRDMERVVSGNTVFGVELYDQLRGRPGNLFLSPYSVSTALAMTHAGARGDTAAQMADTLHLELPPNRLHAAFAALQKAINAPGADRPYQLHVANALWGQAGLDFQTDFLAITRTHYGAGFREVDFASDPEAARQRVNAWVEEQTREKIRDLLPMGTVTPLTRLILTNAIYFKGDWAHAFPKAATRTEDFQVAPGQTVPAPLMHQSGRFGYTETDQVQVLELPYKGDTLGMTIVLPRKVDGLEGVERSLSAEALTGWMNTLQPRQAQVALPRFKIESQAELTKALSALGMPAAFSDRTADFSGIAGKPHELYITAVLHKAFVDVNEVGTEAAAATGVVVGVRSAIPAQPPVVFRADHPFLFLIRDRATGSVLFLGRVVNPTS